MLLVCTAVTDWKQSAYPVSWVTPCLTPHKAYLDGLIFKCCNVCVCVCVHEPQILGHLLPISIGQSQ